MNEIQKLLIKCGRSDLVQKYYQKTIKVHKYDEKVKWNLVTRGGRLKNLFKEVKMTKYEFMNGE